MKRKNGSTGIDGFVEKYYSHSTFHHLSKWKYDLKEIAQSFIHDQGAINNVTSRDGSVKKSDAEKVIVHVDLDSFYVSAVLIDHPSLVGLPVVVCPSKNTKGTTEISSASYEARGMGIKARMLLCDALALCPDLHVTLCDYDTFQRLSLQFFEILMSYQVPIEVISADEAFLDFSSCWTPTNAMDMSEELRGKIFREIGCRASVGIGKNKLLARLATKRAKPDGVFSVNSNEIIDFLQQFEIIDLPGIGLETSTKLSKNHLHTISELREESLSFLKDCFGEKTGQKLYDFSRGIDPSPLKTNYERKSVSSQVSWGIRCSHIDEVEKLMTDLSINVSQKLIDLQMTGGTVTLKIKKKKLNGKESKKYLNPGEIDLITKSKNLSSVSNDHDVVSLSCIEIFKEMGIEPSEVRGIGISISKLNKKSTASLKNKRSPIKRKNKQLSIQSFFQPIK